MWPLFFQAFFYAETDTFWLAFHGLLTVSPAGYVEISGQMGMAHAHGGMERAILRLGPTGYSTVAVTALHVKTGAC